MKKLVLFMLITFMLLGCAPAPTTPDVNAISTQAVSTAYANLTKAPPAPTAESPLLIRTLENAHMTELAWTPDGQTIASAACQETCQLNLYTIDLSPVWSVEVDGTISYLDYNPDGKLIAALVKNGIQSRDANGKIIEADQTEIWLFNAQDGVFLRKWDAEQAVMLNFNPLGTHIATAGVPVILWEVATGKDIWRLEPIPVPKAEQLGHIKLAKLSASPWYGGGPSWTCQIEIYDTVSFSMTDPVLIIGGKGLGSPLYPPVSVSDLVPCYGIKGWKLVWNSQVMDPNAFVAFSSEQFPQPQKIAWQVIASSSVSGLAVMNSGFYLPVDAFSLPPLRTTENNPPQLLAAQGWGLDFAAVTISGAAISPSAERAAVWGQTPDNPPAYFMNLFDARTSQQIAEIQKVSDPALSTFSAAFSPEGSILASIDQSGSLKLWLVRKILP
jgi:WD40 repeat protein